MKYSFAVAVLVNHVTALDWMCIKDHAYYLKEEKCAWACAGEWEDRNRYNCKHGLSEWTCELPAFAGHPGCKQFAAKIAAEQVAAAKELAHLRTETKLHGDKAMHMWEYMYNDAQNHLDHLKKEHHHHVHHVGHKIHDLRDDARKEEHEVHVDNHHAEKYIAKVGELEGDMKHIRDSGKFQYERRQNWQRFSQEGGINKQFNQLHNLVNNIHNFLDNQFNNSQPKTADDKVIKARMDTLWTNIQNVTGGQGHELCQKERATFFKNGGRYWQWKENYCEFKQLKKLYHGKDPIGEIQEFANSCKQGANICDRFQSYKNDYEVKQMQQEDHFIEQHPANPAFLKAQHHLQELHKEKHHFEIEAYEHGIAAAHDHQYHANVDHIKIQKLRDERHLDHAENHATHAEEHYLQHKLHHDEDRWERATKDATHSTANVQVDTENTDTIIGTSAIAVTGLVVVGASYLIMNNKRQFQKTGLETALIDEEL